MTETARPTVDEVRAVLKNVLDPSWNVNIVDLGLVYGLQVEEDRIRIDLSLTRPDAPEAGTLATEVEGVVRNAFDTVDDVEVGLVFDPPWSFDRMSDSAKEALDVNP